MPFIRRVTIRYNVVLYTIYVHNEDDDACERVCMCE